MGFLLRKISLLFRPQSAAFATVSSGPLQLYFTIPEMVEIVPEVELFNFTSEAYQNSQCDKKDTDDKAGLENVGYIQSCSLS